jgi:THO complex subunit 5
VYQDVPLYSLEEFEILAPEENRTERILADEHQLMLNRLNFELAERQRCAIFAFLVTRLSSKLS